MVVWIQCKYFSSKLLWVCCVFEQALSFSLITNYAWVGLGLDTSWTVIKNRVKIKTASRVLAGYVTKMYCASFWRHSNCYWRFFFLSLSCYLEKILETKYYLLEVGAAALRPLFSRGMHVKFLSCLTDIWFAYIAHKDEKKSYRPFF